MRCGGPASQLWERCATYWWMRSDGVDAQAFAGDSLRGARSVAVMTKRRRPRLSRRRTPTLHHREQLADWSGPGRRSEPSAQLHTIMAHSWPVSSARCVLTKAARRLLSTWRVRTHSIRALARATAPPLTAQECTSLPKRQEDLQRGPEPRQRTPLLVAAPYTRSLLLLPPCSYTPAPQSPKSAHSSPQVYHSRAQ